jgi:hypothetical protein
MGSAQHRTIFQSRELDYESIVLSRRAERSADEARQDGLCS